MARLDPLDKWSKAGLISCTAWDASLNTNTCSFTVTVTVAVPPTITDVSYSGGTFSLSFATVSGLIYTVEYAVDMDGSLVGEGIVWPALNPSVTGDGAVHTVSDPSAGPTKRFYRVRAQ